MGSSIWEVKQSLRSVCGQTRETQSGKIRLVSGKQRIVIITRFALKSSGWKSESEDSHFVRVHCFSFFFSFLREKSYFIRSTHIRDSESGLRKTKENGLR